MMELQWISMKERMPQCIEGKEFTEPFFAIEENHTDVQVFRILWTNGEDKDGNSVYGPVLCNCYGDIHGDGEWDDEYNVTHWFPIQYPAIPATDKTPNDD